MSQDLSKLKIETGIPCTKAKGNNQFDAIIDKMQTGDSVLFTEKTCPSQHSYTSNQFACRIRFLGFKASCRKVACDQYRVWKLERKSP